MAIRIPNNFRWATFPPRGMTSDIGLITTTYTRKLTYGQIKGIKGLLKMMKRLKVSKKLVDVAVNEIESNMGSPGVKCTYRVRIRYSE